MRHKIFISILATIVATLGLTAPTSAASLVPAATLADSTLAPTFVYDETDSDSLSLQAGSSLFLLGNNVTGNQTIDGLLFSAGNNLGIRTKSDYAFLAGNTITFSAETAKDLFSAGNNIVISNQADIGRDAFLAGNTVTVEADLPGNLAVTASRLILNNVKIAGNVDLAVESLVIAGEVEISGRLSYNSDATVTGLDQITAAELTTYEPERIEVDALATITSACVSILGLFITLVIILVIFPRLNRRITRELDPALLGRNLLTGLCVLVFAPLIALFLIITAVGAPAGLILIGFYIIGIYLARAFSGYWLGKLIVERACHKQFNPFIEAFLGITLLGLVGLVPFLGSYITLVAIMFGLGLLSRCVVPHRHPHDHHDTSAHSHHNHSDHPESTDTPIAEPSATSEDSESDPSEEE